MFVVSRPAAAQNFAADIEWSVVEQLDLQNSPLDMAASADGKWLYILVPGEILLYSFPQHAITKHIPVEEGYDMVTAGQGDSFLVLSGASTRNVKFIQLTTSYLFSVGDLPHAGPEDARVTVAVFSDYQCPYCKNVTPLLEQVMAKYPADVKVVFKNFPLTMHKSARMAATAALAAARQQKFDDFHRALFENQQALDEAKLNDIAESLSLNMEAFAKDLKDPALQQIISRDINEGQMAGVRGTPTVFVNGKRLSNRNLQSFSELVDAELAPKK
jgi:protein-disulfide isomerase